MIDSIDLAAIAATFVRDIAEAERTPRVRRCSIRGHGGLVVRSDDLCDYYCPDCRRIHHGAYVERRTRGRDIVAVEAARRGGACQFVLIAAATEMRCCSLFADGALQWHHRNPAEKFATISALAIGTNRAALVAELAKCDLLCRGHHRIVQRSGEPEGDRWKISRP